MLDWVANVFLSKVLILLINAVAFYLATLIYRDGPRKKVNLIYLFSTLLMFLWINAAYIPRFIGQNDPETGLVLLKIAWFATPLFFSFLYLLTVYLIGEQEKYKILNKIVLIIGIITAVVTGFTSKIVTGIEYIDNIMVIIYGPWMYIFLGAVSLVIAATLVPIFRENVLKNKRIIPFLAGVFIFYVANVIFNIVFPIFFGFARFYFFGDYSTLILLIFTAYGILRYRFLNIKVIATELLTFAIWLALAVDIFTTGNWGDEILEIVVLVMITLFGILLIRSVKNEIKHREQVEKLAKQLRKANAKLKKLDKAKSEFLSIAAHQLRTPLTGIKGYLSMMIDGDFGTLNKEQLKIIKSVFEGSERLNRLVNVFLNISRIESGRLKFEKQSVFIVSLVERIVRNFKFEAQKRGLKLIFNKPKKKIKAIIIDQDKITDVINNLIDNAIKYTKKGSVTVEIKEEEGRIIFSVTDSGIGISDVGITELFNKFSRSRASEKVNTTGSGLGLYIAKRLIEAHGGKIWAKSRGEGKGSTFTFSLPVK